MLQKQPKVLTTLENTRKREGSKIRPFDFSSSLRIFGTFSQYSFGNQFDWTSIHLVVDVSRSWRKCLKDYLASWNVVFIVNKLYILVIFPGHHNGRWSNTLFYTRTIQPFAVFKVRSLHPFFPQKKKHRMPRFRRNRKYCRLRTWHTEFSCTHNPKWRIGSSCFNLDLERFGKTKCATTCNNQLRYIIRKLQLAGHFLLRVNETCETSDCVQTSVFARSFNIFLRCNGPWMDS
jgi:hypothetical protein